MTSKTEASICAGRGVSMENFPPAKFDDWNVYSRSGKAYPRWKPRNRADVSRRRWPFIKKVLRRGRFYCYFKRPDGATSRLPDEDDVSFDFAYLNELAALEGDQIEAWAPKAKSLVYFIQSECGPIKIGYASNIDRRFRDLMFASPSPLFIAATTLGGAILERAYHAQFAAHRLHGEWFTSHPDILAEIERLSTLKKDTPDEH